MFDGTSFTPQSFSVLSWLLDQIVTAIQSQTGGGIKVRRRISPVPLWLPDLPIEEDEALLLTGLL